MTREEFFSIDWHRGNRVRLSNGNEYKVSFVRKGHLILKSEEWDTHFLVAPNIIEERTSDFIDTSVKEPKQQPAAVKKVKPAAVETPKETANVARASAESHVQTVAAKKTSEPDKPAEVVKKAEAKPEAAAPKRKRQRIVVSKPVYERASNSYKKK